MAHEDVRGPAEEGLSQLAGAYSVQWLLRKNYSSSSVGPRTTSFAELRSTRLYFALHSIFTQSVEKRVSFNGRPLWTMAHEDVRGPAEEGLSQLAGAYSRATDSSVATTKELFKLFLSDRVRPRPPCCGRRTFIFL